MDAKIVEKKEAKNVENPKVIHKVNSAGRHIELKSLKKI